MDEYAEDDETMRGFGRFLSELAAVEGRATLLEAARDEHVRVLVGPGALPALPWEAPYRSGEPTVFQEGTLAVRAAYRARGVQPGKLQRVPDDHVALECAFMALEARRSLAQLIAGDVCELAAGLRAQQSFAVEHMAAWLGEYAKGLRRSATAVLYPQAAEALAAFVALDATFLAEAALWTEEVWRRAKSSKRWERSPDRPRRRCSPPSRRLWRRSSRRVPSASRTTSWRRARVEALSGRVGAAGRSPRLDPSEDG